MTYSDFTLVQAKKAFALTEQRLALFENIVPLTPSTWLSEALDIGLELALTTASEKARSEFVVVPILFELERRNNKSFAIYSGERLDVDKERGLTGECDFILAQNKVAHTLQAPVFALVEAKKNDIAAGLGQCCAQMVGAQLYNELEQNAIPTIFGCVTTGEVWQFLRLRKQEFAIDNKRYYIDNLSMILAVLQNIFDNNLTTSHRQDP
ncbi:hypothetical protein TI04_02185 [Achromatium sp. WMS2]|nr:hypothetical protein TI04_02185 [Achromatium sp. WMS2]